MLVLERITCFQTREVWQTGDKIHSLLNLNMYNFNNAPVPKDAIFEISQAVVKKTWVGNNGIMQS